MTLKTLSLNDSPPLRCRGPGLHHMNSGGPKSGSCDEPSWMWSGPKSRKGNRDTHGGGGNVKKRAETVAWPPGAANECQAPPGARILPSWAPWSQTSSLQNCARIHFCCFKSPSRWSFVIAALLHICTRQMVTLRRTSQLCWILSKFLEQRQR